MIKSAAVFAAVFFFTAAVSGEPANDINKQQEEAGQGLMTEDGQMPAVKQLRQLEMIMQDSVQVMGDIVRMQQKIVEGMSGGGKRNMKEELSDLSARVNTLAAGMKGMLSQGTGGQAATGGPAPNGPARREPLMNAPRVQEKTEAGVRVSVAQESANGVLVFRVALFSATEDLDEYAFAERTALRAAGGREFLPRLRSQEGAGVHRAAILEFDNPGTRQYEVVLRNIGGVPERIFPFPF